MCTHLEHLLSKAYVLGGSPCSGKSTIAEMLSVRYGFHYYKADDHESQHMQYARPDQQPVMCKYSRMGWDEIWSRAPEKLCADELAYYHERFPFILDDLRQLGTETPVILEGAAFLPDLIHILSVKPENVLFLIPAAEFQSHHYRRRPWITSILDQCHDPREAFKHWMKRDELFASEVARQANVHGYQVITVDGSIDINQQFESIRTRFKLNKV